VGILPCRVPVTPKSWWLCILLLAGCAATGPQLSFDEDCRDATRLDDGSGRQLVIAERDVLDIPLDWLDNGVPSGGTTSVDGEDVIFSSGGVELRFVETNVINAVCTPWLEPIDAGEDG